MNSSPYLLIHVSMISLYQVEKNPKLSKKIKNERTNTRQVIFSFLDARRDNIKHGINRIQSINLKYKMKVGDASFVTINSQKFFKNLLLSV